MCWGYGEAKTLFRLNESGLKDGPNKGEGTKSTNKMIQLKMGLNI